MSSVFAEIKSFVRDAAKILSERIGTASDTPFRHLLTYSQDRTKRKRARTAEREPVANTAEADLRLWRIGRYIGPSCKSGKRLPVEQKWQFCSKSTLRKGPIYRPMTEFRRRESCGCGNSLFFVRTRFYWVSRPLLINVGTGRTRGVASGCLSCKTEVPAIRFERIDGIPSTLAEIGRSRTLYGT